MDNKFWVWDKTETNTLRIDGVIAETSWFGDEVTPEQFKQELGMHDGEIAVWLNSPGGDVFAAVQIYNMLKEHKGKVTVKIDSLAASAASVIAMAGDDVRISPCGMLMVHDPMSLAFGNETDLAACIDMLREVKEAIINAYEMKTGVKRTKLAEFMTNETWLNAKKAVDLGFCDGLLYEDESKIKDTVVGFEFNSRALAYAVVNKIKEMKSSEPKGVQADQLQKRLDLIK